MPLCFRIAGLEELVLSASLKGVNPEGCCIRFSLLLSRRRRSVATTAQMMAISRRVIIPAMSSHFLDRSQGWRFEVPGVSGISDVSGETLLFDEGVWRKRESHFSLTRTVIGSGNTVTMVCCDKFSATAPDISSCEGSA